MSRNFFKLVNSLIYMNKSHKFLIFFLVFSFLILFQTSILAESISIRESSGGNSEQIIRVSNNMVLLSSQDILYSISTNGDLLWLWKDEGPIFDVKFLNDWNSDGYKEILVISESFTMSSTKILDGKTGNINKLIPITQKTYKNNWPTSSSGAVINGNDIIISNFKRIYQISNKGSNIDKKLDLPKFVQQLAIINDKFMVADKDSLTSYNLNFKKEDSLILKGENSNFRNNFRLPEKKPIFSENNFLLTDCGTIQIYNSNFIKQGEFDLTLQNCLYDYDFFLFDSELSILEKNSKKLITYGFSGNKITEITNVVGGIKDSGNFYYVDSSNNVFERNTNTKQVTKLYTGSHLSLGTSELISKDYSIVMGQNNGLSLYEINNLKGSYNLDSTKKSSKIGGKDFIIDNNWPFAYIYKNKKGQLTNLELKEKNLVSIDEVSDLNGDGYKEILLGFSTKKDNTDIGSFILLNTVTGSTQKISFIPADEDVNDLIDSLDSDIEDMGDLIDDKNDLWSDNLNEKTDLETELNDLLSLPNQNNNTLQDLISSVQEQINDLEDDILDLQSEINNLQNEKNSLEQELQSYQNDNFAFSNQIQTYVVFNEGRDLLVTLTSDNKYKVTLSSLEEQRILQNFEEYYNYLINVGDINSNGYDDIMFMSYGVIGIFDTRNYDLIWKEDFSDYYADASFRINEIRHSLGSNYAIIPYSLNSGGDSFLMKINIENGNYIGTNSAENIKFVSNIEGNLVYTFDNSLFVFLKNGAVKDLTEFGKFSSSYTKQTTGFSPLVFYDCNNDGNKDILFIVSSYEATVLNCLDTNTWQKLKETNLFDAGTGSRESITSMKEISISGNAVNFKTSYSGFDSSSFSSIKLLGDYLVVKKEGSSQKSGLSSGFEIIDLNGERVVSRFLENLYESNGLITESGKLVGALGENIITSPIENSVIKGDFEINLNAASSITIINVDNQFYTSTTEKSELLKLKHGTHLIEASYFNFATGQYVVDSIEVNVKRPKSLLPYFAILLTIAILLLGGLRWKKMKR